MLAVATFCVFILNSFNHPLIEKIDFDKEWLDHKAKYKLEFVEVEEVNRKAVFVKNFEFIMRSNTKNTSFTLKMNEFGHLEKHERPRPINLKKPLGLYENEAPIFVGKEIPLAYDWRDAGVVSPVENQLKCGSCYAFGAIGAIESQFAIHTDVLPELSKQEIIDCSWKYGNSGCQGGYPENVYAYSMNNGLSTSLAYPYSGGYFPCNRNNPNSSYKLAGYKWLTAGDENNLLRALFNIGPISIAIDDSPDEFDFYKSGIIDLPSCSSVDLNHIVLAVGYSLHEKPYLLVKNSRGTSWGIDGYFKIALFRNNMCGISSDATFPIPKID